MVVPHQDTKVIYPENLRHRNHNHYHHQHHECFNDQSNENNFNNQIVTSIIKTQTINPLNQAQTIDIGLNQSFSNSPILLLTPTPSFASLLTLASPPSSAALALNHNVVIDSSILFLNHYKSFVKLLYDSMDMINIQKCLTRKGNHCCSPETITNSETTIKTVNTTLPTNQVIQIESLDEYLERLVLTPRSLKSITRRAILSNLVERQNLKTNPNMTSSKEPLIINQVCQLPLPERVKEYLLFIEY